MRLYHVTTIERAAAIRHKGFRDSDRDGVIGVWFSDKPLWEGGYIDEPPGGWVVLAVKVQSIAVIDDFFVATPERPYKEWCIPAEIVNRMPLE